MSSRLLDVYRDLQSALPLEIAAFEARSRKMAAEFRKATDVKEDLDQLDTIETQIGMRVDEAKLIERNILLGLERLALGLHVPDIHDYLSEEVKKKTPGTPSLTTQESVQ